ncbi:hypothetical protein RUM44_009176 [Polyplax serrata]|uniref:Potassium channel domain-containing protein n=1 Tax=Polyplax serrata TaxID=468196 RepID=A0ABR1ARX9_POLSC
MNVKQWIALLILYVGYLLMGAMVFYYLEKDNETVKRNEDFKLYKDLMGILKSYGINKTTALSLENYCGRPLTDDADMDDVSQEYWTFYKSIVFVLTVVSTVGYGNINPTMPLTRYLMIIYAVIGLPINAILLTSLASFFSTVFIRAHKKYKRYESRFGLTVDVLTYLIPGILVFIFIPATAFYYFEEWTYEESVYFAFVTLTTIGFGDYVAGQKSYKGFNKEAVAIYKALLLGWIIFGLGYLIMLLGYLTRAMRSKKVVKLEQKLIEALTRSKIWNGVTKDLGYLRRIMNELYLDKFKPVFRDDNLRFHRKHTYRRSKSLPNIIFGVDDETLFDEDKISKRKRAQSEFLPCREGLMRVFSESDLHRIDRHATFASASAIRPSELLRQVVGAMEGSMICKQDDSMGINVFSDDEILQSENWYDKKENIFSTLYHPPSYEDIVTAKRRERALSEIAVPRSNPQTITGASNIRGIDWTWSGAGATHIFNIVNEQHKNNLLRKNSKNRSLNPSQSFLSGALWFNPLRKKRLYSESQESTSSKVSTVQVPELRFLENIKISENEHRKTSLSEGGTAKYRSDISYMTHTAGTGTKGLGLMHGKMNPIRSENHPANIFRSGEQRLLDETSLGDFLRALNSLHNRVGPRQNQEDLRWTASCNLTPPPQSHSLIDLSPTRETPPKLMVPGAPLNRTESMPLAMEKEPYNLKRLGRFLLRSYSTRSESNPDVTSSQFDRSRPSQSEGPTENAILSENPIVPSVKIQVQAPFGNDFLKSEGISRSYTMDSSMRPKKRDPIDVLGNPFRPAASTESVYQSLDGKGSTQPRQTSLRWRTKQGDTCSSKPSLSNVREVNN